MDLTRRPSGKVDRRLRLDEMSVADAALYEEPFRWVKECVYPMHVRPMSATESCPVEPCVLVAALPIPRPGMWAALDGLSRYIATPARSQAPAIRLAR